MKTRHTAARDLTWQSIYAWAKAIGAPDTLAAAEVVDRQIDIEVAAGLPDLAPPLAELGVSELVDVLHQEIVEKICVIAAGRTMPSARLAEFDIRLRGALSALFSGTRPKA